MKDKTKCPACRQKCPILEINCPHCNTQLPGAPNVRVARTRRERNALQVRYEHAVRFSTNNNLEPARDAFEKEVRENSHAVLSLTYSELRYLVENERRVFSTFYQRVEQGLQIPLGEKWDVLRGITEHALYQHQKGNIRFAALSLDHIGVTNYGDCHVTLTESMIADRTSTFEDNNVVFTVYAQQSSMKDAVDLPVGHVSDWEHRHLLAVAKHAITLTPRKPDRATSAAMLIHQGGTTTDDRFIELHIWGPMTVRTVEYVVVTPKRVKRKKLPKRAEIESIRTVLEDYGVTVEER